MNSEDIAKFLRDTKVPHNKSLKITFKKRDPVYGMFVQNADTSDLESKNFWRIVTSKHLQEWRNSNDLNLSRIFHGGEFSKLSVE